MTTITYPLETGEIEVQFTGELLAEENTPFQNVKILQTKRFGNIVFLDDLVQYSERDEAYYHESFVHPGMSMHPAPKNVLIIGGGDGGALREALKHPIEKATIMELDQDAARIMREHAPIAEDAFKDERATLAFGNGKTFIEKTNERFDVIILDLTEPTGPSVQLFTKEFYDTIKATLNENGIVIAQANSPIGEPHLYGTIYTTLKHVFKHTKAYSCYVPCYFEPNAYIIASDRPLPENITDALKQRNVPLTAFTPELIQHLLTLQPYDKRILEQDWPVSTKENPIHVIPASD